MLYADSKTIKPCTPYRSFKFDWFGYQTHGKKWQDQNIMFGILIYTLCRYFQNYTSPVSGIDPLSSIGSIELTEKEFFNFV